jgi:hypothetical protein
VAHARGAVARAGGAGTSLAHAARTAFTDGFHVGFLLTAAVMLASAVVALVFLPSRDGARSVSGADSPDVGEPAVAAEAAA